jgi:hypothetical protein
MAIDCRMGVHCDGPTVFGDMIDSPNYAQNIRSVVNVQETEDT